MISKITEENLHQQFPKNKIIEIEIAPGRTTRCLFTTADYLHTYFYHTADSFLDEINFDSMVSYHVVEANNLSYFCFNSEDLTVVVEVTEENKSQMQSLCHKLKKSTLVPVAAEDEEKIGTVFDCEPSKFQIEENLSPLREAVTSKANQLFQQPFEIDEAMTFSTFMNMSNTLMVATEAHEELANEDVGLANEEPADTEDAAEPISEVSPEEAAEGEAKTRSLGDVVDQTNSLFADSVQSLPHNSISLHSNFSPNVIHEFELLPEYSVKCLFTTELDDTFRNFIAHFNGERAATLHFKRDSSDEEYLSICCSEYLLLVRSSDKVIVNEALFQLKDTELFCIGSNDRSQLFAFWKFDLLTSFATEDNLALLRGDLSEKVNDRFTSHEVSLEDELTNSTFLFLTQEVVSTYFDLKSLAPTMAIHMIGASLLEIDPEFPPNTVKEIEIAGEPVDCVYGTEETPLSEDVLESLDVYPSASFHFATGPNNERLFTTVCSSHAIVLVNPTKEQLNALLFRLQNSFLIPVDGSDQDTLRHFYIFDGHHFPAEDEVEEMFTQIQNDTEKAFQEPLPYGNSMGEARFLNISHQSVIAFRLYKDRKIGADAQEIVGSIAGALGRAFESIRKTTSHAVSSTHLDEVLQQWSQHILNGECTLDTSCICEEPICKRSAGRQTFEVILQVPIKSDRNACYDNYNAAIDRGMPGHPLECDIAAQEARENAQREADREFFEQQCHQGALSGLIGTAACSLFGVDPVQPATEPEAKSRGLDDVMATTLNLIPHDDAPALYRDNLPLHSEFTPNEVCKYELFPGFAFDCLYSTGMNDTLRNFLEEMDDTVATISFCNDHIAVAANHQVVLLHCNEKIAINEVLYQIRNNEVYCIGDQDRSRLFTYWKFDLLCSFARENCLNEIRNQLEENLCERFTNHDVTLEGELTLSSFLYMTQQSTSTYYDITSRSCRAAPSWGNLDEVLQQWSQHILNGECTLDTSCICEEPICKRSAGRQTFEVILQVPIKSDRNACYDNYNAAIDRGMPGHPLECDIAAQEARENAQREADREFFEQQCHQGALSGLIGTAAINLLGKPVEPEIPSTAAPRPRTRAIPVQQSGIPSLIKQTIDLSDEFTTDEIHEIELFDHGTFKCLYSTQSDETFSNFVQEIGCDKVATIHFTEKNLAICSLHHLLLMNRETGIDRVAFNRVIYQIQNSTIYCIEDEDLTLLFSYWKYDYLRSFATENELKAVRSELSHHLDDRFAQYGVELNDSMTNSTFLFLTKEVSSVYYDLAPKPGVKVYNLDNVLNLWASHCLAEKTTFVNPEEGDSITNSEEPCLEIFNKDFDIHTSFQPNVVQEIEVLPNFKVNCLISTADDETVCKYISSLKTGKVSSIHFSNSPNCLTSYFSFCTGTDLIVLTNPTVVQMSAVVRKLASTFVVPCTQGDVTHLFFYDYLNKVSKLTERTQIVSVVEEIKNASNAIYTRPFIYDTTLTVSRFMNICQSTVLGYYIRSQYLVKAAAPSSFNKFSLSGFIFLRRITYNVGLYLQRSTGKLFAIKNFDSVFQFNQSVYAYKNKHMSCLIPCYGSIQENEHNYLVFAFASRGTLQDVLADHYLNLALSRKITIQLVFAIAYLHLTGMYPCNLRAENVVISWDYDVYLINFDEYQRALHRAPAQFDLYNLSSILYTLVSYEQATSLSTLTNNFGIITQLFELCRRSDATVSDLVSLILSSTRNLKNEEELINRLSDELPTRGHIIDVVPDELSLRYFKANCDCPSIVPFLKALRLGDCVAFHFVDENNTFVFASHTVCGTLTNASPEAINALLKKMEYTFIVPVQESDLRKLFTYFYFDILRSFCRGDELENVRSRIPSTIEQMNNFEDKNIIASTLAAFFTATHPEAVPLAINEPEESSKLAPSPLAPSPLEPMEQLQPVQMEPSPPSSPRNVSLLNPRFSIHNQINYDVPCIVEVFNDFYVKALFSSGDNQALRDFVQELGCDQVATVLFHKEYVCFVTVNHLLVINRFENVAINRVLYQIQNSIVYCIGEEDRSTLFNYWKFDLLKHFASEENLQRLRNDVAAESKALFTISLTADQTIIKSMTFSTLFYMAQDAVVAYYLIHCPDHELPNPRARAVPQQPQDASQTLDGTSFQTFLGVTDNTDVKKAFELYTQAAAKHDPAALFNLGLMYSRGEGIPKDKTRAAEYYTQAAALGNAKAQFNLGLMYAKGDGIAQNKAKAVELYTQAADQGSAKAQSNLGLMYSKGDVVDVDYDKAVELYTKAAEQGDADAQLNLGLMYDQGEGVPVNKARAVELYTQAADKGNAKAQFNLGVMYHKGEEGVPKDNEKAVELYSMAAAKGIAQAQFNLGVMYSKGDKNVPVNKEKAVQLFTMAAKQGDPDAQLNLGAMYAKGDGVEQNKEKTIELYTQAAEKGSAKAQFNLGVMYSKGDGVQQDKAKAVEYYEQAAKQRIPQAQFNLGVMYFKGDGIQKDKPRAAELFEEAANRGNSKALFNLAVMNQKGDGIPENKERALELYEKSAKFNNVDALLNLGVMYGEGEGCQKDKAKAIEYYTRAAELGNAKAQLNLGLMYHNGDGCEQDCEKARYYYEKAAAQGNAQAQLNLGLMYAVVNRERATQLLEKSADQGNADALLSLGNMYSGSDANKSRAVECYAAAAAQGNPEAQCKLGAMYLHGDGVEQDLDKAEQLLLESVTGGDFDEALLHLGDLYEMRGDSQRAADYFRRAAERGVPDAESRLSQQKSPMSKLFEDLDSRIRVIHTRHIDPTSEEYGDFKATLRNIEGIINIPTQHETKKGLSDCINVYTVANNVIKTTECNIDSFLRDETLRLEQQQGSRLPSLKRTGSGSVAQSHSNSSLGSLNNEPIEDEELSRLRYEVEALESQLSQLNQQILNSRQPRGINATGSNSSGLNVQVHQPTESPRRNSPRVSPREPRTPTSPGSRCPPSPRSARTKIKSLTRKAEEGDTQAQYALGACYALGEGVQVDKEKAFEFYKQAAESGNVNAQFAVAACYSYGKGTEVDKEKAFEFYKLAAEQGHAKAQFALGHFYAYGQGVEPDQDKAVEWYGKAADQGHYAAKKALDEDLLQDYDSNE